MQVILRTSPVTAYDNDDATEHNAGETGVFCQLPLLIHVIHPALTDDAMSIRTSSLSCPMHLPVLSFL